jgi:hypothetical protein
MDLNEIIADILYEHLKGKHKDSLSVKLANDIIEAFQNYQKLTDQPELIKKYLE